MAQLVLLLSLEDYKKSSFLLGNITGKLKLKFGIIVAFTEQPSEKLQKLNISNS